MRRLLAAFAVAAGLQGPAAPAPALETGISDQQPAFLTHPWFTELGVARARLVIPWDAVLTGDTARADAWLGAAAQAGVVPLVALDHARGTACPGDPCPAPSAEELEAAIVALRERWPQVTEITPWNEPNHRSQPTWQRPALAAAYYAAARRACPGCTLVAGDLLDDSGLRQWLRAYRAALPEEPAIWGLHNYFDSTYFSSAGVDTVLREVPGQVWLTETGGIVRHTTPSGELAHDERRAADSIRWLYAMTPSRPRVTRMYLYQWQSSAGSYFDAGLLALDGSARPGLDAVRAALHRPLQAHPDGTRGVTRVEEVHAEGRTGAPGAAVVQDDAGRIARLAGRGIQVPRTRREAVARVSCIGVRGACLGRLFVVPSKSHRGRPISALYRVQVGSTGIVRVRLARTVHRALLRRTKVQIRLRSSAGQERVHRVKVTRSRGR